MVDKILFWEGGNILYVSDFSESTEKISGHVINGQWDYVHSKRTLEVPTGVDTYTAPLPTVYDVDPSWEVASSYNYVIRKFLESFRG